MEVNNKDLQKNASAPAVTSVISPSSLTSIPSPKKKFNLLMLAVILFLLLVMGGGGYYLGLQNGKSSYTKKLALVPTPIVARIPTKAPSPISPTPVPCFPGQPTFTTIGGKKYVVVKEMGLSFPVSSSLLDITYCIQRYKGRIEGDEWAIRFSTKTLSTKSIYCSLDESGIGLYIKRLKANLLPDNDTSYFGSQTNKELKERSVMDGNGQQFVKEFPEFYIEYIGPQAVCSQDEAGTKIEGDAVEGLSSAVPLIQIVE